MTKEEIRNLLMAECTGLGSDGTPFIKSTPAELLSWIEKRLLVQEGPLFSGAFTGMHDKNGKPICEGSRVKLYYKGEYVVCTVVYDKKHAAFFIKWPDGYVNQYFMNGSNYELVEET